MMIRTMKPIKVISIILLAICSLAAVAAAQTVMQPEAPKYDAELAKKLGLSDSRLAITVHDKIDNTKVTITDKI